MNRLILSLMLCAQLAPAAEVAGVKVEEREDFYVALLKIWLGDKPVDADLKKAMLGQGG